jgi:hypothetical protein
VRASTAPIRLAPPVMRMEGAFIGAFEHIHPDEGTPEHCKFLASVNQ